MAVVKQERRRNFTFSIWGLIVSNLVVCQLTLYFYADPFYGTISSNQEELIESYTRSRSLSTSSSGNDASVPMLASSSSSALAIPQGKAVALPSIRIDDNNVKYVRGHYGGQGDKPHLGGFANNAVDLDGVAPNVWKWMVQEIGIKSLLDVGCGRGVSTSWFHTHGVATSCVEGSHDAVEQSLLPSNIVTEHDFSRGPWWPQRTVDAIWCVELLEHVGRNFHVNLIPSFRKAGVIFASHSTWGGWHHVEVHMEDWWIQKFESYGFRYSEVLTRRARAIARADNKMNTPDGRKYSAQHIILHMLVFINPEVTALPEHHHLFAEGGEGCFEKHNDVPGQGRSVVHRPCGTGKSEGSKIESKLPDAFLPLQINAEMDAEWEKLVFGKSTGETMKAVE